MLTEERLKDLAEREHPEGIVSVFINFPRHQINNRRHPRLEFENLVKAWKRRQNWGAMTKALEREQTRIEKYLENLEVRGRGLALFCSEPAGLWETINLNVNIPNSLTVDRTTATSILMRLFDEYPRLAIVVIEKDRAAIYESEQSVGEEVEEVESSEVPGQHRQGGWSSPRFDRHIEWHVDEHMKRVVEELEGLQRNKPFSRLALGGPERAVLGLQEKLPNQLKKRLIGTFPVNLKHDSEEDILERARELNEEYERESEKELVQQLSDEAGANNRGVFGLMSTIDSLHQGKVYKLVFTEDVEHEGSECLNCHYFSSKKFDACPACGGPAQEVPNVWDRALEKAFLDNIEVEIVHGEARDLLLNHGGVGALLHYA